MVKPVRDATRRHRNSALGPRGRGIFDRLFGNRSEAPQPEARTEARSIAIASGKGGTGKSFLATGLSVLLHQAGVRVTLVDCDFGLACDHLLLGVKPTRTLQEVVSGAATMADVRMVTPAGPALVPGGSGVRQMADLTDRELQVFGRELGALAATEDVILLDAGAGIGPQAILTMLCAEWIVLVTQPEIAALTDAYAVVKSLVKIAPETRFAVVFNRVQAAGDGERAYRKLAEVAQRHTGATLRFLGEVGDDPLVSQRRLGQVPLVLSEPNGPTATSLATIRTRLQGLVGGFAPRTVEADQDLESRFRAHRLFL